MYCLTYTIRPKKFCKTKQAGNFVRQYKKVFCKTKEKGIGFCFQSPF